MTHPRRRRVAIPVLARLSCATFLALSTTSCFSNDIYFDFDPPVVCRSLEPRSDTVFFIGDAGQPRLPAADSADPDALIDPVLVALAADVREEIEVLGADHTAVVVLGDNVYPSGMPPAGERGHERAARILDAQIAAIGAARGFFVLGNHDWDQGKEHGWVLAKAQADYLSSRAPNISVNPADTCAGPDSEDFGEHLRFIFFDLWAAMYQIDHPDGPQSHCTPTAGDGRVADAIEGLLGATRERRTVFAVHPPMLTSGPHGGYFPWREHLFPLRVFNRNLWIPLPVIGSIFPLARSLGVTDTDMMNSKYRSYVETAKSLFEPGHPTLVAAGHEHSLQVHVDPTGVFHAVSGAGSTRKVDYVRNTRSDLMTLAAPGYMRLDVYEDASLRLNVVALDDDLDPDMVFSTCIP